MAQIVLLNPKITINSVDLSNRIVKATIDESYANVDTTAFGQPAKTRVAGLGDNKVTLEFQQDFAASETEATIGPLVGLTTTIVMFPLSATTATTTNPSYTMVALVDSWKPLDGKVGDLSTSSVTWPISGSVTKATS